jgi:hypothetical protein
MLTLEIAPLIVLILRDYLGSGGVTTQPRHRRHRHRSILHRSTILEAVIGMAPG